jgi:hypothetical protein
VERVDTSFSDLDFSRTKHLTFEANTFHNITKQAFNPLRLRHSEATPSATWTIGVNGELPFGGHLRGVDSIVAMGRISAIGGGARFDTPYAQTGQGSNGDQAHLIWSQPVNGEVAVTVRMDT